MAQAQCFIWDKKSLYSTNTRNQYIQPPYKDAINTKKFLQGIKDGKYWCLNSDEVNGLKVCADPPKKYDLAQILGDVMLNYRFMGEPTDTNLRRTGLLIKQKPPDVDWQLKVLSTLMSTHEIFNKDYCRPRNEDGASLMVSNPNGYFDGLPILPKTGKHAMSLFDSES